MYLYTQTIDMDDLIMIINHLSLFIKYLGRI